MEYEDFYLPIVQLKGHPSLTIKWEMALKMLYFSESEALAQLTQRFKSYCENQTLPSEKNLPVTIGDNHRDFYSHFRLMSQRPGMYGLHKGWNLRCYLYGMKDGGDWLNLPVIPALNDCLHRLEERSSELYGSRFALFHAYEDNTKELLQWIEPMD